MLLCEKYFVNKYIWTIIKIKQWSLCNVCEKLIWIPKGISYIERNEIWRNVVYSTYRFYRKKFVSVFTIRLSLISNCAPKPKSKVVLVFFYISFWDRTLQKRKLHTPFWTCLEIPKVNKSQSDSMLLINHYCLK